MTSRELLRKLNGLGAVVEPSRGKGGHVMVRLGSRRSVVPTSSGEIRRGTFLKILHDLDLRPEDLT